MGPPRGNPLLNPGEVGHALRDLGVWALSFRTLSEGFCKVHVSQPSEVYGRGETSENGLKSSAKYVRCA